MKIQLICVLVLLSLSASVVLADNDVETPWPVEERCVSEPTLPPDDWTFNGTLLMSGYAGIHALQSGWETPRVEAFFYADDLGKPIEGGQISPDGKWYAAPVGEVFTEITYTQYWKTDSLRIYSTSDDVELKFDLNESNTLFDETGVYPRFQGGWTYEAVQWIDQKTLIIGSFLMRPFEQKVELSPLETTVTNRTYIAVSPDWTRVYGHVGDIEEGNSVFDPHSPDEVINYLQVGAVAWRLDSSGFIAEQRVDTEEHLSLFTRDGEFVERVFVTEGGPLDIRHIVAGRNELGWSHDNRYFAFVHYPPRSEPSQLMLLDTENRIALNTCLSPVSQPVWSPDSTQVAVLLRTRENLRVAILDVATWQVYDVARHSGISGALSPDMIAWRNNN